MPNVGAERNAQMTEKDKLALRKPLAPKGDDDEFKAAYEERLKVNVG